MTKLSDLHAVLLSAGAQRDSGSLLPVPETLADKPARTTPAIKALIKRGLACERATVDAANVYRSDGDVRYGVFITPAGVAAIGLGDEGETEGDTPPSPAPVATVSKREVVLDLLGREDGATLAELVEATGWLPHSTRAALTDLRKKGHSIERSKRGDVTSYRIVAAA